MWGTYALFSVVLDCKVVQLFSIYVLENNKETRFSYFDQSFKSERSIFWTVKEPINCVFSFRPNKGLLVASDFEIVAFFKCSLQ